MENPLDSILVVGSSENVLHDQLTSPCHNHRVISEVRVFKQDAVVLLMDADCILDRPYSTCLGWEVCIDIMNCTLAIAA